MPSIHPMWITLVVLVCYSGGALAFGAGNIPEFAFLEGKAYRHGDIEDILAEMLIRAASSESSGVFDFVKKVAGMGGEKFSSLNVKRTYFGNWLRDYSQAVDVGTLAKGLDVGTIRILIWILGFMSFGYATAEFEVTEEKLGVYRPEEHIDNPKDYADNIDARQYDRRLRGPVDRRELEVDPRTGIKNYIANEQGGWATSTRYIRESLLKAIELGRRGKDNENDMHEALRLLGQSLHTLEDLGAHSNWVELALIEMGYHQVFPHVGSNTQISVQGSNKRVWPLVTGTFGGTDFIHSLLGEATDKLSQTSLTDLNAAVSDAEMKNATDTFEKLKGLLKMMPGGDANENLNQMQQQGQNLAGKGKQFHLQGQGGSGQEISPQDIAKEIYPVLEFRDKLMKSITNAIEKIPGLDAAIDEITNSLTVYVLNIVQPFIKPIMQVVSDNVSKGGHLVMTDENQYLVWNDPNSSDPTHSMLSKDHFSCYLNNPAGQVAQVIVRHAVTEVVAAWSDHNVDPHRAIDSITQCFCHPALLNRSSQLHMDMFSTVQRWIDGLPREKKDRILEGLTREGVRQGKHHDEEKRQIEQSMPGAHSHGPPQQSQGGYAGGQQGGGFSIGGFNVSQGAQALGFQDPTSFFPGSREVQEQQYYRQQSSYQQSSYEQPRTSQGGYGRQTTERHSEKRDDSYSQGGYEKAENESYYGRSEEHEEYKKPSHHQKKKHHKKHDDDEEEQRGYGQREVYETSSRQRNDDSYGRREEYTSQRAPSYGRREEREDESYRETPLYSQREESYSGSGQAGDRYQQGSYNTSSYQSRGGEYEDTSVQESFSNLNVRDDNEYGSSRRGYSEESQEYRRY